MCVQHTSPGTGPCPRSSNGQSCRHLHASPFRIRPRNNTRDEMGGMERPSCLKHSISDTHETTKSPDECVPVLSLTCVGGAKRNTYFIYLADTPYPGAFHHMWARNSHGDAYPTRTFTLAVVSDREIFAGKIHKGRRCDRTSPSPPPPRLHREHVRVSRPGNFPAPPPSTEAQTEPELLSSSMSHSTRGERGDGGPDHASLVP